MTGVSNSTVSRGLMPNSEISLYALMMRPPHVPYFLIGYAFGVSSAGGPQGQLEVQHIVRDKDRIGRTETLMRRPAQCYLPDRVQRDIHSRPPGRVASRQHLPTYFRDVFVFHNKMIVA
jgi:hypothetical protein